MPANFKNEGQYSGILNQGSEVNYGPVYKGPVHLQSPLSVPPPTSDELQAADGRFAGLPLDEIPAPVPVPNGSYIPVRRNPVFVGRAEDLKRLAAIIKVGEMAAVTGLGGLG